MKIPMLRHSLVPLAAVCLAGTTPAALIHHWTFEGGSADSGTGNKPLTLQSNASLETGCSPIGDGALLLNAASAPTTGGAVTGSNVNWSTFANGDTRTVAMWVKLTPGQEANATFFGAGGTTTGTRFDIKVSTNQFRVEIEGVGFTTPVTLDNNRWRHVAVVVPVAAAQFKDLLFYIDGQPVTNGSTGPSSTTPVNTGTAIVRIGDSANAAADRDPNGYIDDIRVYDTALSATEVADLWDAGRLVRCFTGSQSSILAGGSVTLDWDLGGFSAIDSLTLTNDQDATVVDAAALTAGGLGSTSVSPTATTTYTLTGSADGGAKTDIRTFTVTVRTTPELLTFTATPVFDYGVGTPQLAWTSTYAKRLEIGDGTNTLATFTLTADGQTFLDAGSFSPPTVTATTTYTLTGWLDEAGSGDSAFLQRTVTIQPAPDFTLHVSPPFTTANQPVTLSWNATVVKTQVTTGTFEGFPTGPTDPITDNDADFDTLLTPGTSYLLTITNGNIAGSSTSITSWTGGSLTVVNNFHTDFSWSNYRIDAVSGTDQIVIHDGVSPVATITDPAQIASGSLVLDPGPAATTTYTGTASITGATASAVDAATVTVGGPGTSYPELVVNDGPLAYYRFEENARSTVVYDSSGNGNHSVSITGNLTSGLPGALGLCGGFNNNETVTTPVTLNPQDPDGDDLAGDDDPDDIEGWTLEALILADDSTPPAPSNFLANQDGTGTGRSMFYLQSDGHLNSFAGNTTSPKAGVGYYAQTKIGDADWYHAVLTCTGNPDGSYTLRFYRDGVLEADQIIQNGTGTPLAPEAATGNWVIGSHKIRQAGAFWKGRLDEIAIYDRTLSTSEVQDHFDALLAGSTGPLELDGPARVVAGSSIDLVVKTGGASTSATIDNGVGTVALGTTSTVTVSPVADTTYVLDVDGRQMSFFVQVIDPFYVTGAGLDNGSGFPFVNVAGLTEGVSYQLFVSSDLVNWTTAGAKVVGSATGTATFTDPTAFDGTLRPKRFYQVGDVDP